MNRKNVTRAIGAGVLTVIAGFAVKADMKKSVPSQIWGKPSLGGTCKEIAASGIQAVLTTTGGASPHQAQILTVGGTTNYLLYTSSACNVAVYFKP